MNSEAEIKSFVSAKHLQKNFDTLFEAKIQSYGNRNDLVFAACRIVHKMVSSKECRYHPCRDAYMHIHIYISV